jgi:raffinose/stachyose/melibiose transport system substrate-binding protein
MAAAAQNAEAPDLSGIELTVWSIAAPSPAQQAVNDAFTEKTGATFDWLALPGTGYSQNALTKWQAGDWPDIFWYHAQPNWFLQLQPEQNLQDISQEAFVETYAPGLGVGGEVGDAKYGVQLSPPSMFGLIYNKRLMEQAGLTPPSTFAELLQFCADARAALPDVAPIHLGGGDQWPLQLPPFQWVADAVAADPGLMDAVNANEVTFSDPRFVDAFAKTKELQDAGCYNDDILTATYGDMQTAMMNDEAFTTFAGDWFVTDLLLAGFEPAAIEETLDVAPIGVDAPYLTYGPPFAETNFFLPKTGDAAHEAAALESARFIMGEGYPIYFEHQGGIPVLEGFEPADDVLTIQRNFFDALGSSGVQNWTTSTAAHYGAFETYMSELFAGTKTPQDVGDALTRDFQQNAKDLGLPGF